MRTATIKPDYGIDAPGLVRFFLIAGCVALALFVLTILSWPMSWLIFILALATVYLLGMGSYMMYGSKIEKIRQREVYLDLIYWRGDEQVLDVGCGRGLMLVAAARRLTSGKATGIDIWAAKDQSSNTKEAPLENAKLEHVSDRVEVSTADMRELPFADQTFDVVLSHWVVHNLEKESERTTALEEMARVLRPAGQIILADIEFREAYQAKLADLGFTNVKLVVNPIKDMILSAVSFGSFRPFVIVAQKSA